ncbi:MAG: hypothetical protein ABH969_05340 [Pseudomonadota bacterium]
MSKSVGRMLFIAFVWFFSLRYYLECMNLSGRTEKLTIDIAFWIMTAFAAWELFGLVKNMVQDKRAQALFNRKKISNVIRDKRSHLVVAVILYIIFIPLTGFYLTSFVAFCVFSLILETRSLIKMIVPGTMIMAFVYGIFTLLLQLSLPSGSLFK